MDIFLSLCVGLGLSAACGFRIFVPLLMISAASLSGNLNLSSGFQWIGTYPALIAFGAATALEIGGYYVPWVDHLLDTVATPCAIVAGTIATASIVTDVSPFLKWSLAVIAGGGVAGLIQTSTVFARGLSTASTGGLANPIFATAELSGAVVTSILSFFMPVLAVGLILCLLIFIGRKVLRLREQEPAAIP